MTWDRVPPEQTRRATIKIISEPAYTAILDGRVSQAQNDERKTRNGVVKCYRSFVIGRYRCHRFY